MFLHEHAPEVLEELSRGLALVTTRCSCEYLAEIFAFDRIAVRMSLAELAQNRMDLHFDYWRIADGREELVARGDQQVIVMRAEGERTVPAPVPAGLREALRGYEGGGSGGG
jgi:enediyne biosynthesis thioesterase